MLIDFAGFSVSSFSCASFFLFLYFSIRTFSMQGEIKWNRTKDNEQRTKNGESVEWRAGTWHLALGLHSWLNCSAFALLIDLLEL